MYLFNLNNLEIFTASQLTFNSYSAGERKQPLVLFLHGFPESGIVWKGLMSEISALGFYCVAPDLRGYSSGARPRGKKNYHIDFLAKDVIEIAESLGYSRFHLVGHDWGSAIGWKVVHDYPEHILSWTGMSVPHLQAFFSAIMTDPIQKKKSRYIRLLNWPIIPELKIKKNNFAAFRKLWKVQSKEEVSDYIDILSQPGALTAALNYYRGNKVLFKTSMHENVIGDIMVPTLFIWGKKDIAVGEKCVDLGHTFMKAYYKFLPLDAGHWLVQTKYAELKEALLEHLLKFSKN